MTALRRALVAVGGLVAIGMVGVAVLAFVTFGSGATASESGASRTPSAGIIASSEASPLAPARFRDRPSFRSCGAVTLAPGGRIPPRRIACLAATPNEGRELVVVSRTTAGDPVVRYYRTAPAATGVEIFEDATADSTGGGWHHEVCRSGQIDQSGACA